MKRKRLNRDAWGFFAFPYYQMRLETADFKGLACVIELIDGEPVFWNFKTAGPTEVAGKGMVWLQLAPEGTRRLITVMFVPSPDSDPPYRISAWYVDVIERLEYDEDGVAAFVDKYLDVLATPAGDLFVDDRDELDEALAAGDLSREQYEDALREADRILAEWFSDTAETERRSLALLGEVLDQIDRGEIALSLNAENTRRKRSFPN